MRRARGKSYFVLAITIRIVVFRFVQNLGYVRVRRDRIIIVVIGNDIVIIVVIQVDRRVIDIQGVIVGDGLRIIGIRDFRQRLGRRCFGLGLARGCRACTARTDECERIEFRFTAWTNDRIALHIVKACATPEAGALKAPFRLRQKLSPSNSVIGREPLPCSARSVKSKITPVLAACTDYGRDGAGQQAFIPRFERIQDDAVSKLVSQPAQALKGRVTVPGDKSISHRALMIGASAVGETRISGLLEGEDVLCTAAALRALGATIEKQDNAWSVTGVGVGGFSPPDEIIDVGNAGTAARLLMGLLATQDMKVHLTGDASLRSRPMNRVIVPLSQMGAAFDARDGGRMPLVLHGAAEPIPIEYDVPVPSAQVKSAILLAALNTPGTTIVTEREATRDHTENMLRSFGADIEVSVVDGGGRQISVGGFAELEATDVAVPGDPSSAAYPGVAALIVPGSEVTVDNVGMNPLRAGLFDTLREMGADLDYTNEREAAGEQVADVTFRHGALNGVDIPAERAPSMIDEYPIVAVAASVAAGETRMRGLAELRVKESDRFKAILDGLAACGVAARAEDDDIVIQGCGGLPAGGAEIAVNLDHRIGMSFLVLGLATRNPVSIDDAAAIGTSFPGFVDLMNGLGTNISETGH